MRIEPELAFRTCRNIRDFRTHRMPLTAQNERAKLIQRLVLIQVLGAPLFFAAVMSSLAYFGQTTLIPVLEDKQTALLVLIASSAGLAVEGLLTTRTGMALTWSQGADLDQDCASNEAAIHSSSFDQSGRWAQVWASITRQCVRSSSRSCCSVLTPRRAALAMSEARSFPGTK